MSSIIYTPEGQFRNIDANFQGNLYFQKDIDSKDREHQVELQIAQKLLLQPQSNIVQVYEIIYDPYISIKYEMLDVSKEFPTWKDLEGDVKTALHNLHQLNCIYIDIKEDNIGYSHRDNCWKLFDFDCSGICTPNLQHWIIKPPNHFMMRDIESLHSDISGFLEKAKYKKKDEVLPELQKIQKENNLTKYDKLAIFICFGKIIKF